MHFTQSLLKIHIKLEEKKKVYCLLKMLLVDLDKEETFVDQWRSIKHILHNNLIWRKAENRKSLKKTNKKKTFLTQHFV